MQWWEETSLPCSWSYWESTGFLTHVSHRSFVSFFIKLGKFFIPGLLIVFIMKKWWSLSGAFSASVDILVWYFFFHLFMWWVTLVEFWMLNQPFMHRINSLVMKYIDNSFLNYKLVDTYLSRKSTCDNNEDYIIRWLIQAINKNEKLLGTNSLGVSGDEVKKMAIKIAEYFIDKLKDK